MSEKQKMIGLAALGAIAIAIALYIGSPGGDSEEADREWSSAQIERLVREQPGVRGVRCRSVKPGATLRKWRCQVLRKAHTGELVVWLSADGTLSSVGRGTPAVSVAGA